MWKRSYNIPTLALGLGAAVSGCFSKADDDDEDVSDIPLLGGVSRNAGVGGTGGTDGTTTSGTDDLLGSWLLTEIDGMVAYTSYSYTYGACTYTYSNSNTLEFDTVTSDGFSGLFVSSSGYDVEGEDCDEGYGYGYGSESPATAATVALRQYEITFEEFGFRMDCTQDDTDLNILDCDYYGQTFRWER